MASQNKNYCTWEWAVIGSLAILKKINKIHNSMFYNIMIGENQNKNVLTGFEYIFYFSNSICTIIY